MPNDWSGHARRALCFRARHEWRRTLLGNSQELGIVAAIPHAE